MLTRAGRARAGATLVELLVALTLAAIVLGTATSTVLRQQRTTSELGNAAERESQLRAATGALVAELSSLAAGSGDLVSGEARDTALQLRSLVAAGVACGDAIGATIVTGGPDDLGDASSGAEPKVGDTLWWYAESDRGWRGRRIIASGSAELPCPLTGAPARPSRRISVAVADTIREGAPLRVTRPVRYSFYRSGDGSWQLGLREWVSAASRFAPPQPVAGPFMLRAGADGSGFRYFDADGDELPVGASGVDVSRVARVRVTVLTRARTPDVHRDSVRRDSVDVALQRAPGP